MGQIEWHLVQLMFRLYQTMPTVALETCLERETELRWCRSEKTAPARYNCLTECSDLGCVRPFSSVSGVVTFAAHLPDSLG